MQLATSRVLLRFGYSFSKHALSVQDTFDARKSIYSESMLHVDIVLKELVIDDLVGLKDMFLGISPAFSAVDGPIEWSHTERVFNTVFAVVSRCRNVRSVHLLVWVLFAVFICCRNRCNV